MSSILSQYNYIKGGSSILKQNTTINPTKKSNIKIDEDVQTERAEILKRKQSADAYFREMENLNKSKVISEGFVKKLDLPFQPGNEFSKYNNVITKENASKEINRARAMFESALQKSLFLNHINFIVIEACQIESMYKTEAVKNCTYEICNSIFTEIDQLDPFDKIVSTNILPGFVRESWELSKECAYREAASRFDIDNIYTQCEGDIKNLKDILQDKINDLSIQNPNVSRYFNGISSLLLLESESAIDNIKDKVIEELEIYQKDAEKYFDAKKDIKDKLDEIQDIDKSKDVNSRKSDYEDDSNKDSDESDAGNNKIPSFNKSSDKNESDKNDANKDAIMSGNAVSDVASGKSDDSNKDNDGDKSNVGNNKIPSFNKPSNESVSLLSLESIFDFHPSEEDKSKVSKPKLSFEEMVDNASKHALFNAHTYNVGDELYQDIREDLQKKLVKAMNDNNIDMLNQINQQVDYTTNKLTSNNLDCNKKYDDEVKRLQSLSTTVQMEIQKKITEAVDFTNANRSTFENLVLSIAKRKQNPTTVESDNFDEFDKNYNTINEAVIYYTTMETFNTLRIINKLNPKHVKSMENFFNKNRCVI